MSAEQVKRVKRRKNKSRVNITTDSFYNHAFGFQILDILRKQEMLLLLEKANKKSAKESFHGNPEPDIVQFKTALGRFAIARTKQGAELIMGNTEGIGMPTQIAVLNAITGGSGPLSRIDKSPGSEATTELFRPQELAEADFAAGLNARSVDFVLKIQDEMDVSYNEIMREERLNYLNNLFFTDEFHDQEMVEMIEYISVLFKNLITFVALDPIRKLRGKTWLEYLPEEIREQKKAVDKFMLARIVNRIERFEKADETLPDDLMQKVINKVFADQNSESMSDSELNHKKYEVLASMLEILFAAVDTTTSAIGSSFYELSQPKKEGEEDTQTKLRGHVKAFFKKKGDKIITFDDIDNPDENMSQIVKFAGHILIKYPPTYLNGRNVLQTIFGNGGTMDAGTVVFVDMKASADDQVDQVGEPETIPQIRGSKVFGHGPKICKGAYLALFEMVTTICHALDNTSKITQLYPELMEEKRDSTFSFQNLYFDFAPAA